MNQQPDTFFREKLQGYQKSMPTEAWNKIELNLDKKSSKGLWIKIAASLSLLILATYLMWLGSSEVNSTKTKVSQIQNNNILSPKTIIKNQKPATLAKTIQETESKAKIKNKLTSVEALPNKDDQEILNEKVEIPSHEKLSELDNFKDTTVTMAKDTSYPADETDVRNTQSVTSHITLIYTVEEVHEKYLDENNLEEATLAHKNPSTLKKLLNKVYGLKNNQDPLGELRQKKDEILALNFKKRTEN